MLKANENNARRQGRLSHRGKSAAHENDDIVDELFFCNGKRSLLS